MPFQTLKRLILPQDALFFDLLLKQAEIAKSASQALSLLMHDYNDVAITARKLRDFEHRGDELMREIYSALHTTFIVPIDQSDISTLADSLDDIIDRLDQACSMLVIYKIKRPTPAMVKLADVVVKQAGELCDAVAAVSSSKTYPKALSHCNEIKRLENAADDIFTEAIRKLFESKNAIEIIKQKDVLECLENSADNVDRAAQIISDITIKHA